MPLVNSKKLFEKAYREGYAIGAFNVNNMEVIQGIVDAAKECRSPVILQVSAGARKYAKQVYLIKLVEAALLDADIPIVLHLDHGDSFELCKDCIDGGFTSVMIDASNCRSKRISLSPKKSSIMDMPINHTSPSKAKSVN
jgi:fructose-bisphosphate aldolase class II